jgi:diadenosine tetraphosphate (Ap4A) HIT family hydrolase
MPGVRDYHVLAVDGRAHPDDMDELAGLAARIARRLGRELRGDDDAFTIIFNGARTSRRHWAHVHIIPAASPGQKRRAFALLWLKGPLRRVERLVRRPA